MSALLTGLVESAAFQRCRPVEPESGRVAADPGPAVDRPNLIEKPAIAAP
jgi:hypothetical protein